MKTKGFGIGISLSLALVAISLIVIFFMPSLGWTVHMLASINLLFVFEVFMRKQDSDGFWNIVSSSPKDKVVFFLSITFLWTIASLPEYNHIAALDINILFYAIGVLSAGIFFICFASGDVKQNLLTHIRERK